MNIEKVIPLLLEEPRHFIATGGGIQTRPVKIKRPKWDDVYRGYPKNKSETDDLPAPDVFLSIFEKKYYEANVSLFSNACATRVSLGLIEGGMLVKTAFKITKKEHKYINKGFQTSAIGLKNWLSQENVWGSADEFIEAKNKGVYNSAIPDITLVDVQNKIKNRNGVYIILPKKGYFNDPRVTGHATLWVGSNNDVIGGHNYSEGALEIYFWELK